MALGTTLLTGNYDNVDRTSYTTASISPAANSIVVVFYMSRHGTTAPDLTVTGLSATWNAVTSQNDGISLLGVAWAQMSGSPGSGALTLTCAGGVTAIGASWHVLEITGADTSGTIVQSPVGATGSTGTSGTITYSAAGAAGNRFYSFFIHRANEVTAPRTNWTELDDRNGTAPNMGSEIQWRDDGTNETTGSASWTTSSRWQGLGIEVKLATAGPVALAGQSDGTSTATASMIVALALAGASAGVSTATASMILAIALNASSAGTSTASATTLSNLVSLVASSAGVSTATASMAVAIALAASSAGTSTATASMILAIALNALSAGTSTATGTLAGTIPLAGSSAGTSTATASMRLTLVFVGSSAGTSTAIGDMLAGTAVALVGSSAGIGLAFGDLGFVIPEPRVVMTTKIVWRHGRPVEIYKAHTVPG